MQEPSLAERERAAVIGPGHTFATITDKIASIVLHEPSPATWWLGLRQNGITDRVQGVGGLLRDH